jgi:streptogramin lyase
VAVANSATGQLCLFSNAAALQQCVSDGTLLGATALAISTGGNISVAGSTAGPKVTGAFTLGTNTGAVNAASPVSGGGLTLPVAVAYDGSGTAWFANSSSISEFSGTSAVSGSAGFGVLSSPSGIAVDASGSVWTANSGDNSISVFIGLATPAVTPLAANAGP